MNLLDEETLNKISIIHCYALHNIFGWSIHLLGALWGSVTNLLLHLGKLRPDRKRTEESTLGLRIKEPSNPQQMVQSPLYTELTHTGNLYTHTESNLHPHGQLRNI